jgi:hypothetical protein
MPVSTHTTFAIVRQHCFMMAMSERYYLMRRVGLIAVLHCRRAGDLSIQTIVKLSDVAASSTALCLLSYL